MLACLRKGETFEDLAAGFGIGRTTAWRYVNETVELLAARAPKLRQAVRNAKRAGHAYVILDGTLIPIDRVARDKPFYSGKHKKHGMNLQVIASPAGDVRWVSGALPGSVHDKRAEWTWGVPDELEKAGLVTLAIRATRAAAGRRSRTRAGTSRNRRKKPTVPTRDSAPSAKGQTPSSRPGTSSTSSAAAPMPFSLIKSWSSPLPKQGIPNFGGTNCYDSVGILAKVRYTSVRSHFHAEPGGASLLRPCDSRGCGCPCPFWN